MTTLQIKRYDSVKHNNNNTTSNNNNNNNSNNNSSSNSNSSHNNTNNNNNNNNEFIIPIYRVSNSSINNIETNNNTNNNSNKPQNNNNNNLIVVNGNIKTKENGDTNSATNNSSLLTATNTNANASSSLNTSLSSSRTVNTNEEELNNMEYNKYGFLQPISSSTNTLATPNNARKASSFVTSSEQNLKTNSETTYLSFKERIQNTPIEYFSENLPITVIVSREDKWRHMLENFDEWMKKRFNKIKSRCHKGIPQSIRMKAWFYLTSAHIFKMKKTKESVSNDYYKDCLEKKVDAKCLDEIQRDLHRQFPSHELFRQQTGIDALRNVLRAYAAHNPEVGYCQSQGPIASVLVMNMPEEDAFWMLVIISDLYLKDYFKPDLKKIQIEGQTLFTLFKRVNPTAYKLMKRNSIHPTMYMTEWFMCIYARTLPWCTVLRVWDMFFCEGVKVLYRVGLYLLKQIFADKRTLQACMKANQYDQQYVLLNQLKNIDIDYLKEDVLVRESLKIEINEKELDAAYEKAKIEFEAPSIVVKSNKK